MWEANPPSVAKGDLRKLARPNWSVPLSLLAGDWLIIGMAVALSTYTDNFWVYIFCAGVVGSRQHALFVLVHEGVHKHLARSKRVNDWISNLFAAYPILFDTEAYRENHLRHHEHLNTDQDPDWTRKKGHSEWKFPQKTRNLVLFLPYYICIRGALEWLQIVLAFSGIFVNHIAFPRMRKRLAVKIVYYTCVGVT
ncbi:MAG: fatty acid desaturase, partial [Bdellovibrionales bacterium]